MMLAGSHNPMSILVAGESAGQKVVDPAIFNQHVIGIADIDTVFCTIAHFTIA